LSAYDSGIYHAGPQAIIIKNTTGVTDTIFADPFTVTVSTVPVDTSKAIKPINAPIEVPYQLSEFLPLIGGGALWWGC
jgi:hypothetical protein